MIVHADKELHRVPHLSLTVCAFCLLP